MGTTRKTETREQSHTEEARTTDNQPVQPEQPVNVNEVTLSNRGPQGQAPSDPASAPAFTPVSSGVPSDPVSTQGEGDANGFRRGVGAASTPVSEDTPRPIPEMSYAAPYFSPKLHVLIEGNVDDRGRYIPLGHPDAGSRPRRITIDGKNFEHVSEDPATGGWIYREMP